MNIVLCKSYNRIYTSRPNAATACCCYLRDMHSFAYRRAYEIEWECTHFLESACVHCKCLYKPWLRACTSLASPATTVGLGREMGFLGLGHGRPFQRLGLLSLFRLANIVLHVKSIGGARCTIARVLVTILILCPTMAARSDSRVNHSSPHSSAHAPPRRAAAAELFGWSTCRKLV